MADPDHPSSHPFLTSLLGRQLRVTTSDTRMFVGTMKCTDKDRNIILSATYEYRHPPAAAVEEVTRAGRQSDSAGGAVKVDMSSRFLGLVVVPGEYIERVEVEEGMGIGMGEGRRGR